MIVEIQVALLPETIFLVPDDQADALRAKARNPGRMWSHSEVSALKASGTSVADAVKIAETKMLFKASALWTRPGKAEREAEARDAEQVSMGFE